jgi:hypothetical protein
MRSPSFTFVSTVVTGRALLVFWALATSACSTAYRDVVAPKNTLSVASVTHSLLGRPEKVRPDEKQFADLADASPSSAGYYYDASGTLNVRVADSRDETAAMAHVTKLFASRVDLNPGNGRKANRFKIVHADYTYHQLSEWRDLAFDHVLGTVVGVRTLDLDEEYNRVTMGLDAANFGSVREIVVKTLSAAGVDSSALKFKSLDGSTFRFDFAPPGNLQSATTDPLAGGLQITYSSFACTLGFVAQRNGVLGFVTASHCSNSMYAVDGTSYYAGGPLVATETVDAGGYTCGIFTCRGSDANFSAAASGTQMSVGRILRTYGVNSGSLSVDQSRPYFDVVYEGSNLVVGQQVDKVGRTTGWTSGAITQTCVDAHPTAWNQVTCAYGANYGRGEGDSGAPVFFRLASGDSTEVDLIGVHSSTDGSGGALFSKLERIKSDLGGSWVVIAHAPTPTSGPLRVTVGGPIDVNSSPSCSLRYWANAAGGSGGYTYVWQTDGTITTDWATTVWATFTTPGGHWIQVTVSDGFTEVSSGPYELASSPSGMDCRNY